MHAKNDLQVFIISLDRAVERRAHMTRLCAARGLQANFVSAVDGRNLTASQQARYDEKRAMRVYGCAMSDNEIACYLSHASVYEAMAARDLQVALIVEDDIDVVDDFKRIVDQLVCEPAGGWQVVRLQSTKDSVSSPQSYHAFGQPVGRVVGRDLCRLRNGVLGGCAYLIRRPAAEAMLRYGRDIFMPIDQTLDRYWENGILPFVLRPLPVWHTGAFESEIGTRGRALSRQPKKRTVAGRRLQRALDSFNKRIFWAAYNNPLPRYLMSWLGLRSAQVAMIAMGAPLVFED